MHQFATYDDFLAMDQHYFARRWPYINAVITQLKRLDFETCLELGSNGFQLVRDSDTMDNRSFDGLTYLHDAREPFPIADKQYDLFIALQVWEHLDGFQERAFAEVMRTSRQAVLSFPYLWHSPESPRHHDLGQQVFRQWTLGVRPAKRFLIVGKYVLPAQTPDFIVRNRYARAVYVFKFGPVPPTPLQVESERGD